MSDLLAIKQLHLSYHILWYYHHQDTHIQFRPLTTKSLTAFALTLWYKFSVTSTVSSTMVYLKVKHAY